MVVGHNVPPPPLPGFIGLIQIVYFDIIARVDYVYRGC